MSLTVIGFQALDYLLKPADDSRLREVLSRVRNALSASSKEQFSFQNADGVYRLYLTDILYCYSERRKVFVVTQSKTLSLYAKLDEMQDKLGLGFIRIHQRFLVNTNAVEQIKKRFRSGRWT